MSLDGRGTASIAVKGPHVSLCRRGKARCKGLGDAVCKIRSPGDMRSSFTFEAQISGQTDGRPRVGAKKASNEVVKIWPPRVLAYAGSCKHCLPFRLSRLVRCTPKPDHVPDSNTARARQLPSTVRSVFFIYFRRVQTFWPTRARAEKKARNERREIN